MFKLTVEQILSCIADLSPEEKQHLQEQLPAVLGAAMTSTQPNSGQAMTNSLGSVSFGAGSSTFNFQPVMAGGDATSTVAVGQPASDVNGELLQALEALKRAIQTSQQIDPLTQAGATAEVDKLSAAVQSPEADPSLIEKTVTALKRGLQGVQDLATPTLAVASLVARVWGIPVP